MNSYNIIDRKCVSCGSNDFEKSCAQIICTRCGCVLEDSLASVEQFEARKFVETGSSGGAKMFGQRGFDDESHSRALSRCRNEITRLGEMLQFTSREIEMAINLYKMALQLSLTRGRKSIYMYSACLYTTCRLNESSHLMIDICEATQISCYKLGHAYQTLTNRLCIKVPLQEPCVHILRFADKLNLGSDKQKVAMTAMRIVQRMKKDLISAGRRPSGLCGAALLIAARLHNHNCSVAQIVDIVKLQRVTIRKRLLEFAKTPSADLTFDKFMNVDLEAEEDPPSFSRHSTDDYQKIEQIQETELNQLQQLIEEALGNDTKKITNEVVFNCCMADVSHLQFKEENVEKREGTDDLLRNEKSILDEAIDRPLKENEDDDLDLYEGLDFQLRSLQRKSKSETELKPVPEPLNTTDGELDVTGIDSAEIDLYILSEDEIRFKQDIWEKNNAGFLKAELEKQRTTTATKTEPKKRTSRRKMAESAATASDAFKMMVKKKKLSEKIDYDVLRTLTEEMEESEKRLKDVGCIPPYYMERKMEEKEEHLNSNTDQNKESVNQTTLVIFPEKTDKNEVTKNRKEHEGNVNRGVSSNNHNCIPIPGKIDTALPAAHNDEGEIKENAAILTSNILFNEDQVENVKPKKTQRKYHAKSGKGLSSKINYDVIRAVSEGNNEQNMGLNVTPVEHQHLHFRDRDDFDGDCHMRETALGTENELKSIRDLLCGEEEDNGFGQESEYF